MQPAPFPLLAGTYGEKATHYAIFSVKSWPPPSPTSPQGQSASPATNGSRTLPSISRRRLKIFFAYRDSSFAPFSPPQALRPLTGAHPPSESPHLPATRVASSSSS